MLSKHKEKALVYGENSFVQRLNAFDIKIYKFIKNIGHITGAKVQSDVSDILQRIVKLISTVASCLNLTLILIITIPRTPAQLYNIGIFECAAEVFGMLLDDSLTLNRLFGGKR